MSETRAPLPDRSVKVPHLVFALLFLGLAGVWALVASGTIDAGTLPLTGPAVLILAGVVGLAASLASGRNHRRERLTGQPSQAFEPDGHAAYAEPADTQTDPSTDPTEEIR